MTNENFIERIAKVKETLLSLQGPEARYAYLIELGRKSPPFPKELQTPDRIVPGCQSILYIHTIFQEEKLVFQVHSEALISAGLAALLVTIYSNSAPEAILRNPPIFLQEIGLLASLSPHRSNGVVSIYTRMKQEALKHIMRTT